MRRYGKAPRPLAERFWEKVDRRGADECWEWLGHKNRRGYGCFALARHKPARAHRLALELSLGEPLGERWACHRCDNPGCVNPAHLYAGNAKTNVRDMMERRRHGFHRKTTCPQGHPYDRYLEATANRSSTRACSICQRRHNQLARQRRKARALAASQQGEAS